MQNLRVPTSERLERFEPAPTEQLNWLLRQFRDFDLDEYVALLRETNGLGELFTDATPPFVHNMLLVPIEEALEVSEAEFKSSVLAIGRPGVDGISLVLQRASRRIYAYYPIDEEFREVASSLQDFLNKWIGNELRI